MGDRIIDISESGASIRIDQGRLLIGREDGSNVPVALDDLGVLILGNPRINISQPAMAAIVAAGGVIVVCDDRRLPSGMLFPLTHNTTARERIEAQIHASLPLCKQLWMKVVASKVSNQGEVLNTVLGSKMGFDAMARRVRSGDPSNIEAQASRRYWLVIFRDEQFRRRPDGDGPNPLLNYGYAVLRALVARAICAAGLQPSIGIHHHNRYDSFALADDLLEPLRPLADLAVVGIVKERGMDSRLDKESKHALGKILNGDVMIGGELRTVADACARMASSLAQVFMGKRRDLLLPKLARISGNSGSDKYEAEEETFKR